MDKKYHQPHFDEETARQSRAKKQRLREIETAYSLEDYDLEELQPEFQAELERFLK